jgi:hypothetical protein
VLLHPLLLLLLLPQVMQSMLVKERAAASQPDGAEAAAAAAAHEQQILGLVGQLVNEFEQLQKIGHTMFRLGLIEHLVAGPTSAEWGKKLAALQVGCSGSLCLAAECTILLCRGVSSGKRCCIVHGSTTCSSAYA